MKEKMTIMPPQEEIDEDSESQAPSILSASLHVVFLIFMIIASGMFCVVFYENLRFGSSIRPFCDSLKHMGLLCLFEFFLGSIFAVLLGIVLCFFSRFRVIELFWGGGLALLPVVIISSLRDISALVAFFVIVCFELTIFIISKYFFKKNKIKLPQYSKTYSLFKIREFPKIILSSVCITMIIAGIFAFSVTLVGAFMPLPMRPDGLESESDYYVSGLMFLFTMIMALFSRFKVTEFFISLPMICFLTLILSGEWFWVMRLAPITIYPIGTAFIVAIVIRNTKLHRQDPTVLNDKK